MNSFGDINDTVVPGERSEPILAEVVHSGMVPTELLDSVSLLVFQPAADLRTIRKAFPQLEIIEQIGHGGMGFVFKAKQPQLDRIVALKILSTELAERETFAERFAREGKILARLNHPNIVSVYDFGHTKMVDETGTERTFYYLVLEYVNGLNLRQLMREKPCSRERAFEIVTQICNALQYAHSEGVLHRDIKPENILLDSKGNVKIADFGLARLNTTPESPSHGPAKPQTEKKQGDHLTQFGAVLGTPKYMAPEQFDTPNLVDHRADIYSLGLVLYELLKGHLPNDSDSTQRGKGSVEETCELEQSYGGIPTGKVQPPKENIEPVVLKAIKPNKFDRYQSVDEFKSELESILHFEPVHEKDGQDSSRVVMLIGVTVSFLLLCGALVLGIVELKTGMLFGKRYNPNPPSGHGHNSSPNQSNQPLQPGQLVLIPVKPDLPPLPPRDDVEVYDPVRADELKARLNAFPQYSRANQIKGCLSWTLEGKINADASRLFTGSNESDPVTRLFDMANGNMLGEMDNENRVYELEFHPLKPLLYTVDKTPQVHVWDAEICKKVADFQPVSNEYFRAIALNGEGTACIIAADSGRVFRMNLETGETEFEYKPAHSQTVHRVAFHPNGRNFATIGKESDLKIWDIGQETPLRVIPGAVEGEPYRIQYNHDGTKIVATGNWNNYYANVYDPETGEMIENYGGYGETIKSANFSPDGRFVVTGDNNYIAVIWDAATKNPLWVGRRNQGNHIYNVIFSADQKLLLVVAGHNPTIYQMPPSMYKK